MKKEIKSMKNVSFSVLLIFVVLVITCCGGGKSQLNGLWIDEEGNSMAFVNDLCFVDLVEGRTNLATYTFEKGVVKVTLGGEATMPFKLKDDSLGVSVSGKPWVYNKDKTNLTPSELTGIWEGTDGWSLHFVNNRVFLIDEDNDADYGEYNFNKEKNIVTFKTKSFEYIIKLTLNDDKLNALIYRGYLSMDDTFTRKKNK